LFELKQSKRILARLGQVKVTIGAPVSFPADQHPAKIALELERRVSAL
jgi:hypothetical protein